MKKHCRAITLVELLVAVIILAMVMGGVFSADIALRRMDATISMDTELEMQARALAESIRKDVRQVHGDLSDTGVVVDEDAKSVCFRYDVQVGSPAQYTPAVYTDDQWSCYTLLGTNVYQCDLVSLSSYCDSGDSFIGTLVNDAFDDDEVHPPQFLVDRPSGEVFFQMTVVTRQDPSVGAHVDGMGELDQGTEDNPQVVMRIRETPLGF